MDERQLMAQSWNSSDDRRRSPSPRRRKGGGGSLISNVTFKNVTARGSRHRKGTSGFDCSGCKCENIHMIDVHGSGAFHCNGEVTGTQQNVTPAISCLHTNLLV
jgi:hypothetical protein